MKDQGVGVDSEKLGDVTSEAKVPFARIPPLAGGLPVSTLPKGRREDSRHLGVRPGRGHRTEGGSRRRSRGRKDKGGCVDWRQKEVVGED